MADDKDSGWVFDLEEDAELPELDAKADSKKPKDTPSDHKKDDVPTAEAPQSASAQGVGRDEVVEDTSTDIEETSPTSSKDILPDDLFFDAPASVVEATEHEELTAPDVEEELPPLVMKENASEHEADVSAESVGAEQEAGSHDVLEGLDDFGVTEESYAKSPSVEPELDNAAGFGPALTDDDLPELNLAGAVGTNEKAFDKDTTAHIDAFDEDGKYEGRPEHEREYYRVLKVLSTVDDLNVDTLAVVRIRDLLNTDRLPQLIVKDLITEKLIDRDQLARAIARSKGRLELMTIQDLPEGARVLRKDLDSRAQVLMRDRRIVPIRLKTAERGENELHLAHATGTRDMIVEAQLNDIIPGHAYVWHYATRDVAGQYWLSGDEGSDVDEGMEAEALLDRIVSTAVDSRASDIHIDPSIKGDSKATIKYRVDGFAQPREIITQDQLERLRVRIENVARMPKVNLNHPNKGAFSRGGYDWRVQIQPHAGRQGPVPRIVIRRLNPETMSLERLGYPKYFINKMLAAAKAPNGVIFWTGPTGSGKTESIHSAVISADPMARGKSVHTIEDPPEKRVEGYAVQMEISEGDPARSALELLKSSLRADPDVVIFGEVRDPLMAKLVFEAANTGHLVFSTLHTNTSIDALVRLEELGVEGFMLSYVRGIAAQRLARRLCTQCRIPMDVPDDMTRYVFDLYNIPLEGSKLYTHHRGGCPNCNFTGYKGRIAVAEWLEPNIEMIEAAAKGQFARIEEIARRSGWKPMGYMGTLHIKEGITDVHELQDVIVELAMAG